MDIRRFGIKTGIRAVAIALIVFPEPLTTGLGIALLGASLAVSRPKSLKKFGDLDSLIRRSIQINRPTGFRRYHSGVRNVVDHNIKVDYPAPQARVPATAGAEPALTRLNSWFDNRKVSDSVIYHTLKTSFPQYEAQPRLMGIHNPWPVVEHHTLKLPKSR